MHDFIALERPPVWPSERPPTADALREHFDAVRTFTVGIEEELMLIGPRSLLLVPAADRVLELVADDARFQPELRQAQFEIATAPTPTVAKSVAELRDARRLLVERLAGEIRIAAAGSHPTSTNWGDVTPRSRYRAFAKEYPWLVHQSVPCGLHVHVAVGDAERALAVHNAMRSYLPEIAALGANSPFLDGRDTGLCSVRPKLNDIAPRAGVPPSFASWEELADFVAWGRRGGVIGDATQLWWDLRLHPAYGTLELRVADAQTRLVDTAGIAAFFQALVFHLSQRWEADRVLPVHSSYRIRENSWRALRYGVRGFFVDLETGEVVSTRDRIHRLLETVSLAAERLGCLDELNAARALLAGNGADRQRYVAEREGVDGLVRWLVDETEAAELD